MSDRPLDYLRKLHHAHVVAAMADDRYRVSALENPKLLDDPEHQKVRGNLREAQAQFYAAINQLEREIEHE